MQLDAPAEWSRVRLSDLGEVNRGRSRHRPRHAPHLYGGPYPFVQTGDIKASGGRITSHTQTYSAVGLAQSRLWPAGTMCITIAANIAETAILEYPACFPDSVIGFIANPRRCDVRFIEFMFRQLRRQIQHIASDSGTVQDNINLEFLENLYFPLPSMVEQEAIVRVLGVLDDKIELNRRMNQTLEGLARTMFKSWFVDFDPVVAKAAGKKPVGMSAPTAALFPDRFQDSTLGPIPKGWRVARVGDEFRLTMGQSPPGETYNEDRNGAPFFQGRTDFTFRFPVRRVYCTASTRFADPQDTLVSVRAPVGDINMAIERCVVGRGVAAVRHKSGSRSLTYYAMWALSDAFAMFDGDGTLFGSISKTDFEGIQFVSPPDDLLAHFNTSASPLDDRIEQNERQSASLVSLRDALLPQLMSGELRVKQVEELLAGV